MKFSYVTNLNCPKCHTIYSVDEIQQLCECGSPLLVNYDLESLKQDLNKSTLLNRTNSLWSSANGAGYSKRNIDIIYNKY